MAAITIVWEPATPPGSEALNNGDNRITEFKTGLSERLRNGGHQWSTLASSTDQEDGRHVCGTAFAAGATGALAGEFYIYAADGSTVIATIGDSTAASPSRIDVTTLTINAANQRTIALALNPATGVQNGVFFENRAPKSITILGAKLVAGTGPTATDLIVNVLRLATGYANPGAGGTSILTTPASDLKIVAAARVGTETTAIVGAQSVLAQGDAIYVDITTLSAAADIVLYLRCR